MQSQASMDEYLRRNQLHAASVGVFVSLEEAIERLERKRGTPRWLLKLLRGSHARAVRVSAEMAVHRDEVK